MTVDDERTTGDARAEAGPETLGRRLERLPFPALLAGLILFGGVALGLTSIGGAVGITAVLCWAALMAAFLVAACD